MSPRVASSRLIGRAGELAELEEALGEAADGRPSIAFVAGESGVGKTRLLGELMRRARDGGALVLAGETVDFSGESDLAYLPLVAALRPLARSGDPALTEPLREAVAPLLPGLGPAPPADAHGSQARLFEGLLALLDALGRERPVLLVVEDLHWADRSTRAALAFLARSLTDERVLVVASYRPEELVRGHPVRALLAELEPHARRVALRPLSRDELAEQIRDILGAPAAPGQIEPLWERSGGNPLFSEELLAAGAGAAPDTLREALLLRVEPLSDPARELVGLVAVAQRIDDGVLEETAGLESRPLRDALREAVEGHVVLVGDDGAYRCRHPLLREVVADDLLPRERAELHLRLARALEPRIDGDARTAAAVAHHFAASGDRPAALSSAVRAATAAERVYAHGEAAALLDRALDLWERVDDPEARAGADRVSLLVRVAAAASDLGDPGRQLARLETAFEGLGPDPDPERAAGILEEIARAQRHLNRAGDSITTLERAVELGGAHATRASVLASLARARMLVASYRVAAETARDALDLAAGLPLIEAHARNTLGYSLALSGDVEEGERELRRSVAIVREQDAVSALGETYDNYAAMLHAFGRSEQARAAMLEGRAVVAERRPVATFWLDIQLAEIAFDTGDWAEAEARLPGVEPWTGLQSRVGIELHRVGLALGRGDHATAATLLDEIEPAADESSHPGIIAWLGVLASELHRRERDLDAATAAVDQRLERACRGEDAVAVAALAAQGVTVAADAAERARDLGEDDAERAALDRLEGLLRRVEGVATEARPVEHAALLGARAESSRAAGRPNPEAYAEAAAAWDAVGRPEPAARMRRRQAEALVNSDRDTAAAVARAAHAAATTIGAGWLQGEIEDLAARARLPLESAAEAPEPAEDPFGLTERERQVIALVARGATNREIGESLFMAERTASVHVSRILTKLGVRSRTEAAAVALRHQLAE